MIILFNRQGNKKLVNVFNIARCAKTAIGVDQFLFTFITQHDATRVAVEQSMCLKYMVIIDADITSTTLDVDGIRVHRAVNRHTLGITRHGRLVIRFSPCTGKLYISDINGAFGGRWSDFILHK